MSGPMNVMPETVGSQKAAPAAMSPTRPFYWSVRRELWENRSVYLAPLAAAALFLFGYLISVIVLRQKHGAWFQDMERQLKHFTQPYEMAAALIMGTAFIVGVIYSLEALYGERRDRTILFWKSLPVSDLTAVLSKVVIPLFILPLFSFVLTIATQLIMLLLSSAAVLGTGLSVADLWRASSFFHFSAMLLYHIVTVHGLWYAPIYGWLLLVSAWAPRAPFIWAFLPPFVIIGVEKLAFNTSYFRNLLLYRLGGPEISAIPGSTTMDVMAALTPLRFLSTPGLWTGLALAAVFLAVAVRLRRYQWPV